MTGGLQVVIMVNIVGPSTGGEMQHISAWVEMTNRESSLADGIIGSINLQVRQKQ